jgi:hypothetical protein
MATGGRVRLPKNKFNDLFLALGSERAARRATTYAEGGKVEEQVDPYLGVGPKPGQVEDQLLPVAQAAASFVSPKGKSLGSAAISGIRSLLPGGGTWKEESDKYDTAAASEAERGHSVVDDVRWPGETALDTAKRSLHDPLALEQGAEQAMIFAGSGPVKGGKGIHPVSQKILSEHPGSTITPDGVIMIPPSAVEHAPANQPMPRTAARPPTQTEAQLRETLEKLLESIKKNKEEGNAGAVIEGGIKSTPAEAAPKTGGGKGGGGEPPKPPDFPEYPSNQTMEGVPHRTPGPTEYSLVDDAGHVTEGVHDQYSLANAHFDEWLKKNPPSKTPSGIRESFTQYTTPEKSATPEGLPQPEKISPEEFAQMNGVDPKEFSDSFTPGVDQQSKLRHQPTKAEFEAMISKYGPVEEGSPFSHRAETPAEKVQRALELRKERAKNPKGEAGKQPAIAVGKEDLVKVHDDAKKILHDEEWKVVDKQIKDGTYVDKATNETINKIMDQQPHVRVAREIVNAIEPHVEKLINTPPALPKKVAESPEFKSFFKGSKVVDANGEPLVVMHGTDARQDFTVFDSSQGNSVEFGSHFGTNAAARDRVGASPESGPARGGGKTYPVVLNIKNPVEIHDLGRFDSGAIAKALKEKGILSEDEYDVLGSIIDHKRRDKALTEVLDSHGIDGFKYRNHSEDPGSVSWIAVSPNQIKSIFNKGTFSTKTPDIMKSLLPFGLATGYAAKDKEKK